MAAARHGAAQPSADAATLAAGLRWLASGARPPPAVLMAPLAELADARIRAALRQLCAPQPPSGAGACAAGGGRGNGGRRGARLSGGARGGGGIGSSPGSSVGGASLGAVVHAWNGAVDALQADVRRASRELAPALCLAPELGWDGAGQDSGARTQGGDGTAAGAAAAGASAEAETLSLAASLCSKAHADELLAALRALRLPTPQDESAGGGGGSVRSADELLAAVLRYARAVDQQQPSARAGGATAPPPAALCDAPLCAEVEGLVRSMPADALTGPDGGADAWLRVLTPVVNRQLLRVPPGLVVLLPPPADAPEREEERGARRRSAGGTAEAPQLQLASAAVPFASPGTARTPCWAPEARPASPPAPAAQDENESARAAQPAAAAEAAAEAEDDEMIGRLLTRAQPRAGAASTAELSASGKAHLQRALLHVQQTLREDRCARRVCSAPALRSLATRLPHPAVACAPLVFSPLTARLRPSPPAPLARLSAPRSEAVERCGAQLDGLGYRGSLGASALGRSIATPLGGACFGRALFDARAGAGGTFAEKREQHGQSGSSQRSPLADAAQSTNVDGIVAQLRAERDGWSGMRQLLAEVD